MRATKTNRRVSGLVKPSRQDARDILRNAKAIAGSELVAKQEFDAAPFPTNNHPDLEIDREMVPTKASTILDTLTLDINGASFTLPER